MCATNLIGQGLVTFIENKTTLKVVGASCHFKKVMNVLNVRNNKYTSTVPATFVKPCGAVFHAENPHQERLGGYSAMALEKQDHVLARVNRLLNAIQQLQLSTEVGAT
jgi:hypothetical protein